MSGSALPSTGNPVTDAVVARLLKPGSKTTEFLVTLLVHAGSLTTLLGAFDTHSSTWNAVLKAAALLASAAAQLGYANSRGTTKAALGAVARWTGDPQTYLPTLSSYDPAAPSVFAGTVNASGGQADLAPPVDTAPVPPLVEGGFVTIALLGVVLLAVGVLLAVVAGSKLLLTIGVVVAVIGALLALNNRVVR